MLPDSAGVTIRSVASVGDAMSRLNKSCVYAIPPPLPDFREGSAPAPVPEVGDQVGRLSSNR